MSSMIPKNLLPSDFFFYKIITKEKVTKYYRIPYHIVQNTTMAEQYIDRQSALIGDIIERKIQIPYKTFIEEYLKPEGLWTGD